MAKRERPKREKKTKGRFSVADLLFVVLLLVGLGLIAYPTVADWWNSWHQSRAIASMVESVEDLGPVEREEALQLAAEYNATLVDMPNRLVQAPEGGEAYASLLDITGTGIMAYIEIPSLDIKLPIYHGTDEGTLQVATGHLPGSSLPIGGASTHTVITGHTGLPSARLFTDISKLEIGDVFYITALEEPLAYEVDQIKVVLPEEYEDLAIVEGEDLATLVTCTPYGVNSHRLLVRGHRIDLPEEAEDTAFVIHTWQEAWPYVLGAAGAMGIVMIVRGRKRRKHEPAKARD